MPVRGDRRSEHTATLPKVSQAAAAAPQPLFSPHSVYDLVEAARRPASSKPLPAKGADVYKHLAFLLTHLKHLYDRGQPGAAAELDRKRKEIARAIWSLTELLPTTRINYEVEVEVAAIKKWEDFVEPGYANWAHKLIAAFDEMVRTANMGRKLIDELARAANEARELGLPIVDIDWIAPKVAHPTDLIKQLNSSLSTSRLRLSVSERHRLIVEVVRLITGETLNQEKVRDRLRKLGK
jgi:hypothetical protein